MNPNQAAFTPVKYAVELEAKFTFADSVYGSTFFLATGLIIAKSAYTLILNTSPSHPSNTLMDNWLIK